MTIHRVNAAWQNWPGAPGVTTFYFGSGPTQAEIDAIRAYFLAFITLLPTGLTVQVPSTGDTLDELNGDIASTWSVATTPAVVTATGAGTYAGNAGAVMHWLTDGIVNSRRVRGRSFMVPLISSAYDAAGSLSAATLTAMNNAGNALLGGTSSLSVWARPIENAVPPAMNRNGSKHLITGIRVPDLAVSLRSRRV